MSTQTTSNKSSNIDLNDKINKLKLTVINQPVIQSFHNIKIKTIEDTDHFELPLDYGVKDIQIVINKLNYTYDIKEIKDKVLYLNTIVPKDSEVLISCINLKDITLSDTKITKDELLKIQSELLTVTNDNKKLQEYADNLEKLLDEKIKSISNNLENKFKNDELTSDIKNEVQILDTKVSALKDFQKTLQKETESLKFNIAENANNIISNRTKVITQNKLSKQFVEQQQVIIKKQKVATQSNSSSGTSNPKTVQTTKSVLKDNTNLQNKLKEIEKEEVSVVHRLNGHEDLLLKITNDVNNFKEEYSKIAANSDNIKLETSLTTRINNTDKQLLDVIDKINSIKRIQTSKFQELEKFEISITNRITGIDKQVLKINNQIKELNYFKQNSTKLYISITNRLNTIETKFDDKQEVIDEVNKIYLPLVISLTNRITNIERIIDKKLLPNNSKNQKG